MSLGVCIYQAGCCHSDDNELSHQPKVFSWPMKRQLFTGFLSLWISFHFPGVYVAGSHMWIFLHNKLPLQHDDAVACVDGFPLSIAKGRGDGTLLLFHFPSGHLLKGPMDHLSLLIIENRTDRNTCIQAIPLLE